MALGISRNPMEAFEVGRKAVGASPVANILKSYIQSRQELGQQVALKQATQPIEEASKIRVAQKESEFKTQADIQAQNEFLKSLGVGGGQAQGVTLPSSTTQPSTTQGTDNPLLTQMTFKGATVAFPGAQAEIERRRREALENEKLKAQAQKDDKARMTLQHHLDVIKNRLEQVPPTIPDVKPFGVGIPGRGIMNTGINIARSKAGVFDPKFSLVSADIQASVGNFMQTIENLPRGRLTQGEIMKLSHLLTNLPLLGDKRDRQEYLADIERLMQKATVHQPSEDIDLSTMSEEQLQDIIDQGGTL